ncbi:cation:dicarboxylase symporter family transporter [Cohnella lubricantis]|uniref:Cation:dicarboxylase symporter family transporter n=1 Tax=Cohnella lubricantis TaxID=2163172 RepID=A0A841TDG7_9BACL|nr:cation:dicarboxylase symporter family transporter [Cohnella lubricantis]MBB6679493.1 cation:dicarboxylase symporter family transporter [Cohnella lubricantis]MBP2118759.1 proton glutamate symport protein [Cohnella lubricantis]
MNEQFRSSRGFNVPWHWLKSGWSIALGIALGVAIGLYDAPLAGKLSVFGDLYLTFLKMCVIPIMITSIIPSLGRLLSSHHIAGQVRRMAVVFVVMLLAVSAIAAVAGLLGHPGHGLSASARETLGQTLLASESGSGASEAADSAGDTGFFAFLREMIPANIFSALVDGQSLQILFFSVLFGVTVGFFPASGSEPLLSLLDLLFKVFQKIISWSLYLLPFALLSIMANQIAQTGLDMLLAMERFVLLVLAVSAALMLLSSLVIAWRLRIPYGRSWSVLKTSLIVGFGTRNSIATLPSMLEALRSGFRLNREVTNLVVPLGVILCRYSMVIIFSMCLVFLSQLYYIPLGRSGLPLAVAGAVIAAIAGAGSPAVVSLSMLSIVAAPLGLPYGTAVVMLLAVTPVIDPFVTAANVHLNCAAAVLIADREATEELPDPLGESDNAVQIGA